MTKHERLIRQLAKDGWTVDEDGNVFSPLGFQRKLQVHRYPKHRVSYLAFNVKDGRMSRPVMVHKLAAFLSFGDDAFVLQVRHLDGNPQNNAKTNLALGTGSQNMLDRPQEERAKHGAVAAKVRRVLSDDEVRLIRGSCESGVLLANRLGVAKSTVSGVRRGKFYKELL